MIDLHNHILPGLDDGSRSLEESREIARQFLSEGVVRVAATPHLDPLRGNGVSGPEALAALASTRAALADLPLDLVSGQEVFLTPEAPELLRSGMALPLGGSHAVLVEVSPQLRPLYLDDTLFRLQAAGYLPILAHPERYDFIQRDDEAARELVERGVVLQLTAPALLGEYGGSIRRTAERLLRAGLYALAASDRHHPGPNRSLEALHDRITAVVDSETADLLLIRNPSRVLAGETPVQPTMPEPRRRPFLARLFRS